ncbi:MAG TPA: phosphate acetyltransferase, partial [Actinoplanes sp.]|nr:phosphate acetyltransferase [Actinoplanes sp.]
MRAVARSVYIAGLGPGGGKGTVALGVAELLSRQVARLGVFRPLVASEQPQDSILALLGSRYPVVAPYADSFGVTTAEAAALVADGKREELIARIIERYRELERRCATVLVIGSDFTDGHDDNPAELPAELAFNARLATEFGSVVVAVVNGMDLAADPLASAVRSAYHSLVELNATVLAVIANRVAEGTVAPTDLPVPVYVIPEVAAVSTPTVAEVATALDATVLTGGPTALDRDVHDFVVGAGHVPTILEYVTDGALVITPGDRNDLTLAVFAAHAAGYVNLAGVVLTIGKRPDERTLQVIERLNTGVALLLLQNDSYHTIAAASRIEGKLSAASPRKVDAALGMFEAHVDTAELARRLDVTRSRRVTPLMFEYNIIDLARSQRRHLVLPEGTEERILRAAESLLRRGVADLTLLGDPAEITRRAREIGVDVAAARLVDPVTSEWRDDFAKTYAQLRKHRAVTLDLAYDVVRDVNYFGTLMVAAGLADGMVSGATHTTAATIRPAFEIIKTVPGVSVASSVFFMLLADRVL